MKELLLVGTTVYMCLLIISIIFKQAERQDKMNELFDRKLDSILVQNARLKNK